MPDQLIIVIVVVLALAVLWALLKAVLKLTKKVFSCGLFLILVIGIVIFVISNFDIF
jgi:hypothetical protein